MTDQGFDIEAVIAHFEESLSPEEDDVGIPSYLKAYEELSRMLNILGMIFSFVESDVKDKREILKKLHSEDSQNYSTVKSMVDFEILPEGKPKNNGSRTLLRLHRALEFIILFVEDIHKSTPESNISDLFRISYDKSLARHHGWFIRKTVGLASHAVPNRNFLVKVMFSNGEEPTAEDIDKVAKKFADVLQNVYKRVQVIYEDRQILNLPTVTSNFRMTLAMNKDPEFVEEIGLGLGFSKSPAFFDDKNKYVYLVSENCVFVFNARSGKRLYILRYNENQLIVHANDQYCVSITESGLLLHWDVESQSLLKADNFSKYPLTYVYRTSDGFYCVSTKQKEKQTFVSKLILEVDGNIKSFTNLGNFPKFIQNKKQLTITDDFVVVITSKVHLDAFGFKGKFQNSQYICRSSFQKLEKQNLLAFDSLTIVDDTLYASLNIGRILFWKDFSQDGFKASNMSFFHRNPSSIDFLVFSKGVLYIGCGDATVTRWNLNATGNGRWQKPDNSETFDSPVSCLSLSKDGTLLSVQLEDNTIWIIQTSSMNIVCELQTMQWNQEFNWLPLCKDSTRPDLVLTGGRLGNIQWVDPTKWRTVAFFDVTDENTPPRDNIPYGLVYDWLNVYLVNASPSTLVTVERRRNKEHEPSMIKFFRRNPKSALADLVLEDMIEWEKSGLKVMSSNDDLSVDEAFASLKEEEIVFIDKTGQITVFIRDVKRSGRWLQDLSRTSHWMGSKVNAATSVRNNCFAAIHTNGEGNSKYILIWQLEDLSIYKIVDAIADPLTIEWAPIKKEGAENLLIISSKFCVSAFDIVNQSINWIITVPHVSIFSSLEVLCCYKKSRAYVLDPITGDLEKEVVFGSPIKQLFVATSGRNLRFLGSINKCAGVMTLCLLKLENAENDTDRDIAVKKTPFAELIVQNREQETKLKSVKTYKNVSIKSKFDGPVYASAPLTRLAPELIKECFIPREELA
ncbi:hypothetical protein FO519_006911 [Halicephalobus sp. NKZ332]|nr:hypothetical protein FO519_006911 [Halicephalobus sp. NKZ332]